jgi:uncharacterized protein
MFNSKGSATVVLIAASISALGVGRRADAQTASTSPVQPFFVGDVKLLESPFRHAMQMDADFLLSLDCDRLLSWYRKEAGLEPKAEVYGGWESLGIAGHSLGHYLSACSRMYLATDKKEFRRRVDYIVGELAECQQAGNDGFVGAMPRGRGVFAEIAQGDIRSGGFDLNGSWVPWYTLHKLFAGLIDANQLCDNEQAKEVAIRLADWADETTKNLTPDQWQQMLACEHGGMNESLAELYAITGDERYLELAKKFYHKAILDPLAAQRDELDGKHANTQIPKVIGAAKIAELTGDQKFATIARFFWQTMVENHTYVTGGNSLNEHLGPPGKLNDRLGVNTTETCNTYNMLKLTSALFSQDPEAKYADYAERALWNHILASQNPTSGMVCYYVALQAGGQKNFQGPGAFTCCSGTGMENHARYGEYIYSHGENALYVNQFISSVVDWQEQGVRVRQLSKLPEHGSVRLEISCDEPKEFLLLVRHPHWASDGFRVSVNGEAAALSSTPGSFAKLKRTWQDGDVVDVKMPLELRLEPMPDNAQRVAIFYGPILLAGLLDPKADDNALLPVLVTDDRPVGQWLKPAPEGELLFRTEGVGRPRDQTLAPFFGVYDRRYIVYWDLFTEPDWERRRQEYEAQQRRLRELAARTVDLFAIGEMQAERDHNLQGENSSPGEFGGRRFRHAMDGGWFSFDIKLPDAGPADLIVTYWGSEVGPRTFDVLLDDAKLGTQTLHRDKPEHFWDKVYHLPEDQTAGKTKATVKFQAHPGNFAGGVFGVRVVHRASSARGANQ